jgi:gluconolactonase
MAAAAAAVVLCACPQDFSSLSVQKIALGFRFTDGPAWSKDGFLVFSDTPSDRILKWVPGQQPSLLREDAHGPAGNAFDSQGRLYTCEARARRVVRTEKDKTEAIAERWEGKRLNAPNDIVVAKNGHVYFTDPAFGSQDDNRELDFYGVYHVPPRGPMILVAKSTGRPNGIALSPSGRELYVSDSDDHTIRVYDLDREGAASNERTLISGIAGAPGGIRVDEAGNLYVAASGLFVYSPQGRLVRALEENRRVTNCAFGGPDLRWLFVTEGPELIRVEMAVKGAY